MLWRGCLAHGLDLGRGGRLRVHSHAFSPAARLLLESCWTIAFSAHRVKGKVAGWCLAGRWSATSSVRLAGPTIHGMDNAAKGRKQSGSPCSASRVPPVSHRFHLDFSVRTEVASEPGQ